ncbi:sugar kinase [Leadbettera azotonutricia]|uniref:Khg/kdpg family aldolase/carbohydrate kinase, pfkb family n=1 Tax=Leadbettera azotonutricia (strain ATCC BAA-888 / DSM 13862 / ZAS-9) TaxID=545695 RepID=F5YDR2_LEAAZ|nr:sugar kinase [Leadbettera azotonutricia]AEF80892.1 khg/kdpg family aldolase/carbohydrate kinase, pfkb family [Leadbettera azotonutricia ZAS-9]
MERIITFGEIMLRLNPEGYLRFTQAGKFEASYAGGEANVAASLAQFGMEASFASKVPAHEIGQCAVNELRRYGVDTRNIIRGGDRLGAYFVEKGASQRASKVIYDRANSAIALAKPEEFKWQEILKGAAWFHFTGITPALSANAAQASLDAVKAARELGVIVSCDLNYRKKLWTSETAGKVMGGLMPYVDLCIANEEDAADVFGIRSEKSDISKGALDREGYISVARQLTEKFGFKKTAITLRGSISASDNNWSGMLYDGGQAFFSPAYPVHIVDRVGGGDSFGAALIYSLLKNFDSQKAINFAVAASCLKHSIEHDFNLASVQEVEALAGGNASGRVQR